MKTKFAFGIKLCYFAEVEVKLSICIPTYNFGTFIGETLDSILPQMTDEVELIVLDSNSKDQTEEVCGIAFAKYSSKRTKYIKSDKRGGIDRDIETVVSFAVGEYVWLFSADDVMLPNTLQKVLSEISTKLDIYLSEHILCDFHLKKKTLYPIFNAIKPGQLFDLSDHELRRKYFKSARTSEAFFSFLSTPIFKKSVWDRVSNMPERFYGTCWAHAGRLLLSSKQGMTIKYLGEQMLNKRGENDSFRENGRVNRIGIAVEGYKVIAEHIFGLRSEEAFNIRRVIRSEFPLGKILVAKLRTFEAPQIENLDRLNGIVRDHYSDRGLINSWNQFVYKKLNYFVLSVIYFTFKSIKKLKST